MPHAGLIDNLIFFSHTWRCLTGTCHGRFALFLFNLLFQNLQISSSYLGRRKKLSCNRFIFSFIHIDSYFHRWSALGRLRYRRIFTKAAICQRVPKYPEKVIPQHLDDHQPPKRIQTIETWNPTPSTKLLYKYWWTMMNWCSILFVVSICFYQILSTQSATLDNSPLGWNRPERFWETRRGAMAGMVSWLPNIS